MSGNGTAVENKRHKVVIIGGGNAGISVAARLRRKLKGLDVAIIDPAATHYYQPLWTLVGAGLPEERSAGRGLGTQGGDVDPGRVTGVLPDENVVVTAGGTRVGYDFLVVAPGIQINWNAIPGLPEALGKDGVCSNYSYDTVDKTWEFIQAFKGGTAVFTQPSTPVKCGGAPQKIAYLADDAFRKAGVREGATIIFANGGAKLFAVEKYEKTLYKVIERKGIDLRLRTELIAIRGDVKEADFKNLDSGELTTVKYDMIHVTPPMSAPDFIRNSPLANADGWVDVDRATLRHTRYPNVFGIGDASSLPTSKTGAAIRKQAPVLVQNLVASILGNADEGAYDGYTACPLVTGYGKLVMAEFDYDLKPIQTFRIDQSKERRSMYLFKRNVLPALYWRGILKGRA